MVTLGIVASRNGRSRNGRVRNGRVRNGRSRIGRSRIGTSTVNAHCKLLCVVRPHIETCSALRE